MLRLKSLEFVGFKSPDKIASVNFSDASISVIYGENGSGKTSFLKAISAFLSQDESTLATLGIKEIKCKYAFDEEVDQKESGHEKIEEFSVSRKEISFDWSKFLASPLKDSKSIAFGVERGISTQATKIEPEVIYEFFRRGTFLKRLNNNKMVPISMAREMADELAYFLRKRQFLNTDRSDFFDERLAHQNLQNIKLETVESLLLNHYRLARYTANIKIQSALFNTLAAAINLDDEIKPVAVDVLDRIFLYKPRLIEALTNEDAAEGNEFKSLIVKKLKSLTEENYIGEIEKKPLLHSLFANMIVELDREKLALSSINLLVDTFNDYLIEGKKLVVSGSEIYIAIDGGRHSIHDLSSGERHILTFLSLVLFIGQDRNFLIIDEPEISLNIMWQRELLALFSKLVPKTQIIVASHSPVLSRRHPEFLTPLVMKGGAK